MNILPINYNIFNVYQKNNHDIAIRGDSYNDDKDQAYLKT